MKIKFLGAVGTVTGSKFLVTLDEHRKYFIDCGIFQGPLDLQQRNWEPLPLDSRSVNSVLLTHAHIDHSGYLPLFMKQGFTGKIYCSKATHELCAIMLPDSGHLQEEEADFANRRGYSRHSPALPLYTSADAVNVMQQFKSVEFGTKHDLEKDLSFTMHHAGHILGASLIFLKHTDVSILFSGDLGRPNDMVMREPAKIQYADYLVLESTYGDRLHKNNDPLAELEQIINKTIKRGGSVVIPSFAVGRAQSLLFYLYCLKQEGKIPQNLPVFLDSPMAINATKIFMKYTAEHRLSRKQCEEFCHDVKYTNTIEDSKKINLITSPKIIISASGMASGGRVMHHLKSFLPDARNTILFTGFQAGGTRGASLLKGETEIKLFGEIVPVNAEIKNLSNTSAHADADEIIAWLKSFTKAPVKTFIVHGEPESSLALKNKIENELGWECEIPKYLDEFNL